ncbi:MAG: siderophore-interacting protein, partial [Mycetocola sp.]
MVFSLRPLTIFPITTRTLEVRRVEDVTPGMRRVTLGGPQLAAHVADNGFPVDAFRSDGFDDEFKLILQHPDAPHPVGPTQADGVLSWPRGDDHLLFRTYTVRRWDPVNGEIDVDLVRHGVGPATTWANRVTPGESVQIAGPKSSAPHPEGADWTLIGGDDTALPAIARWLENWPAGAKAQVFIEIAHDSHRQDLPIPDGVELTWLSRNGAEPGTTTLLHDAITNAPWWDGTVFAWVAGETLSLIPIRRWLRGTKNLPKAQVEVAGYWRRQEVILTENAEGVQDLDASVDDEETFHELTEFFPAFAVRVAATIGLASALNGG